MPVLHKPVPCCVSNLHESMLSRKIEPCAHTGKIAMRRPQVDLAVKHRLKHVWVAIVSELPRFTSPPPTPPPWWAMPLAVLQAKSGNQASLTTGDNMHLAATHADEMATMAVFIIVSKKISNYQRV